MVFLHDLKLATLTLHLVIQLLWHNWYFCLSLSFSPFSQLGDSTGWFELYRRNSRWLIDINSRAFGHLHCSTAFVKGSARCNAVLTYCSFTFGPSNTSYRDDRFNLWTFFMCRSFGLTAMHDLDNWCIVLLTDQINRPIQGSLEQLLHGQPFTENFRL